jgi:hypothetical protein
VVGVGEGEVAGSGAAPTPKVWGVLLALGLALAVVGAVDVALLWFPARWASVDWEFGTVSATIEGMPLVTLGLGLLTASVLARGSRTGAVVVAVVLFLFALFSVVMLVILALDLPVVMRAVDPQLRPTLNKAILKSGIMGVVYVVLYTIIGIQAARRRKVSSRGIGT